MGRRSRKRAEPGGAVRRPAPASRGAAPSPPRAPRRRARLDELPPAPWAPFPLVELAILVGIVCIGVGFAVDRTLVALGLVLVSLGALDQSVREHWAGFRSHSLLLGGALAVLAAAPLFFLTAFPQQVILGLSALVFATAVWSLRDVFRRRSGGIGFRA